MYSCQRLTVHTDRLGIETNYIMFSKRSIFTHECRYLIIALFFLSLEKSLLDVLCNEAAMISIQTDDEAI